MLHILHDLWSVCLRVGHTGEPCKNVVREDQLCVNRVVDGGAHWRDVGYRTERFVRVAGDATL